MRKSAYILPILLALFVSATAESQTKININQLQSQAANTVLGNATGSTAAVTALPMPSCAPTAGGLNWTAASGFACKTNLHTRQVFLTGTSATYTTPAGVRQIVVKIKGGGGGAGGSTTGGTNGGNSIFNGINATGGTAGGSGTASGGTGGTGGAGTASIRIAGAPGQAGYPFIYSATNSIGVGGAGGGAGGGVGQNGNGTSAAANSGGGGGAGGKSASIFGNYSYGGGGGEGEYAEIIINSPAATYAYTVGAKGTGGTGDYVNGDGAAGFVVVDEYY